MTGKKFFIMVLLLFLSSGVSATMPLHEGDAVEINGEFFIDLFQLAEELDEPVDWFLRSDGVRLRFGAGFYTIDQPTIFQGRLMACPALLEKLGVPPVLIEEVADIDLKADPRLPEDLYISLKTDRSSYRIGDHIAVSMIIHNTRSQSVKVQFNTGQVYDLFLKKDGMIAWGWSRDKAFTQAFHSITFEPGEARHFAFSIPTKELRIVEEGEYTLQGVLTSHPRGQQSEPVKVEIKK